LPQIEYLDEEMLRAWVSEIRAQEPSGCFGGELITRNVRSWYGGEDYVGR